MPPLTMLPGSTPTSSAALRSGQVVALTADHRAFDSDHEHATRAEIARRLATLKGFSYVGEYDRARAYAAPVYFAPSDTLAGIEAARALGIAGVHDLFGGVVPHPFVASKVITHSLVEDEALQPAGWNAAFAPSIAQAVLPGYSVFTRSDADRAAGRLLHEGPVRVKPASATGGRSQSVVHDLRGLHGCLDELPHADIEAHGLVLESNLQDAATLSVGQVVVDETVVSYHGTQRTTLDNRGEQAYGGSDLTLVRGGFDALLACELSHEIRLAIHQARLYHQAVTDCYPGFFASRINYDIVQGHRASGEWHSGVLEQSWRIGGASGAELAALESFCARPDWHRVRASCHEVYGAEAAPPAGATVYFSGLDSRVGPISKYTVVEAHGDPA